MTRRLGPQPGGQEVAAASSADVLVFGGQAGGGKSHYLLQEAARYAVTVPEFYSVLFRRTTTDLRKPGGLWDESQVMYRGLGGVPQKVPLEWDFPRAGRVKMAHLEYEDTVYEWQGAQVGFIGFDELTHFTRQQFFYMLSRLRSPTDVEPYLRATCNPDADSWVAELVSWWIDQDTGLARDDRSGVLRWFVKDGDAMLWAGSREEALALYGVPGLPAGHPDQVEPLSFTFVIGRLDDNKALLTTSPGYKAKLKALDRVNRERLLGGNWKIRPTSGMYFQRAWCPVVDCAPPGTRWVRAWDFAATEKTAGNDPDWTVGARVGYYAATKTFYLGAPVRLRGRPAAVLQAVKVTAALDGRDCAVYIPQDPGQAGKVQAVSWTAELAGYNVRSSTERGDKVTRFSGFSAQAEVGNVCIVRGDGMDEHLKELENFPPEFGHDDDADAVSRGFGFFVTGDTGMLDYYREEVARASEADRSVEAAYDAASGAVDVMKLLYGEGD